MISPHYPPWAWVGARFCQSAIIKHCNWELSGLQKSGAGIKFVQFSKRPQNWCKIFGRSVKTLTSQFIFLALFNFSFVEAGAQTTLYGGRGLIRVFSAEPLDGSQLFVNSFFQTFLNNDNPGSGSLGKDHTFSLGLTLGLVKRTELTAQVVAYQDDQRHVWGPPGDTQLGIKYHTPLSGGGIMTGVRAFLIFPTARLHNVPFEPYSSGKLAFGLQALLTLDMTESFPLVPLKLYANVGYLDNDVRQNFLRDEQDQLLLGAGLKFPINSVLLFTEYTAEIFTHLDALSYSENASRLTQGVTILGPWNLVFAIAADIDLSTTKNVAGRFYAKDYADWKIIIGANYQFSLREKPRVGREPLGQISAPSTRNELKEIQARREKARTEMERMNQALQDKPADKESPR